MIENYRVVQTSDNNNLGLVIPLNTANLPKEFMYGRFVFDNIKWLKTDTQLIAHNANYIIVLIPVT